MRSGIVIILASSVVAPLYAQDAARTVIEKAVQAHGGAALDKYPASRSKVKGTILLRGTEFPFTMDRVSQMPGKIRISTEIVSQNVRRTVTYVVNGNTISAFAGGLAQELPQAQMQELKTAVYIQELARLTPLLNDKRFKIAAAGEKTVEGQATDGITVSADGHKDVRLYFARQTGLLTAIERSGHDDQGRAVDQLESFSGYREANGLKYPTKTLIKQSGKRYVESETTEFKPLEKVDPKEFQPNP